VTGGFKYVAGMSIKPVLCIPMCMACRATQCASSDSSSSKHGTAAHHPACHAPPWPLLCSSTRGQGPHSCYDTAVRPYAHLACRHMLLLGSSDRSSAPCLCPSLQASAAHAQAWFREWVVWMHDCSCALPDLSAPPDLSTIACVHIQTSTELTRSLADTQFVVSWLLSMSSIQFMPIRLLAEHTACKCARCVQVCVQERVWIVARRAEIAPWNDGVVATASLCSIVRVESEGDE
jgi:hypothetical protein